MRDTPYQNKNNCSGCGACIDICPKNAIRMVDDGVGFEYPKIDTKRCIQCGLCQNCCPGKESELRIPVTQYAAINGNNQQRAFSSSGGIFPAIAETLLKKGWHVFGATLLQGEFAVRHIEITTLDDLWKIQGSKYVKSDLTGVFKQVKKLLNLGEKVVFAGTPCQVSALKKYVNKEYDTLLLIDLICHGTPSPVWWKESLKLFGTRYNAVVSSVKFRDNEQPDKSHYGKINLSNGMELSYSRANSSFYDLFLNSSILRESCFSCQFASIHRPGDITLGDFWNFSKEYDIDLLAEQDNVDLHHGISCVLVNTAKGMSTINSIGSGTWFKEVELRSIVDNNDQLQHPTSKGKNRETALFLYKHFGYLAVGKYWEIKNKVKKLLKR